MCRVFKEVQTLDARIEENLTELETKIKEQQVENKVVNNWS